jgi:hypothetical protein
MRVRYRRLRDHIDTFAVYLLAAQSPWLVGFVRLDAAGHWVARKRAEPEVYSGFRARSGAASFLAVDGKFAQPRRRPRAQCAGGAA